MTHETRAMQYVWTQCIKNDKMISLKAPASWVTMDSFLFFFFREQAPNKTNLTKRKKWRKKNLSTQEKKVKCGGSMHMCCNVQEGGAGLTLGCREGGGHQGACSSCGKEERVITKHTSTHAHTVEKPPHTADSQESENNHLTDSFFPDTY